MPKQLVRERLDRGRRPEMTDPRPARRPWTRIAVRIVLVIAAVAIGVLTPQAEAQALPNPLGWVLDHVTPSSIREGFDCKEAPSPQMPRDPQEAWFDDQAKNRTSNGSHSYEVYGWAGLKWSTYDLGCGPDVTRAPDAVWDNKAGNIMFSIGKHLMAMSFWLDDQAATPEEARSRGITPMWQRFDEIVTAVATKMRSVVFTPWVGLVVMVAAAIAGVRALQQNTAAVMKTLMLCGAMFFLGGLLVGAPQKAIEISDNTFSQAITGTQGAMFRAAGYDSEDPRNVIYDNVLLPDYYKGWLGSLGMSTQNRGAIIRDLRNSLAFTYDEQKQVTKPDGSIDVEKAKKITEDKQKKFTQIAEAIGHYDTRAYQQFQGKDSGRLGTGALSMFKVGMPSLIWAGGSLLKITGLLVIRFAILFAPIWVPFVAVSGGLLERAFRIIAGAVIWAVVAAGILGIYLVTMVYLYQGNDVNVDGAWRFWFLLLLTIVCWKILRPFKRISAIARQNGTPMMSANRMRGRGARMRHRIYEGAKWAGGPIQGAAEGVADSIGEEAGKGRGAVDGTGYSSSPESTWRPEGMFDKMRRQQGVRNQGYVNSINDDGSVWNSGHGRGQSSRIDDPAVVEGEVLSSRLSGGGGLSHEDQAGGFSNNAIPPSRAQHQLDAPTPVRAPDVWDGGESSPIAPMRLYRPSQEPAMAGAGAATVPANNRPLPVLSITRPAATPDTPRPRIWDSSEGLTDA